MLAIPHITYDHVAEDRKTDFSFEPFENSGKKLHYKMPVTVMSSVIRFPYRSFLVFVVKEERTSSCHSRARILSFFVFVCWLVWVRFNHCFNEHAPLQTNKMISHLSLLQELVRLFQQADS